MDGKMEHGYGFFIEPVCMHVFRQDRGSCFLIVGSNGITGLAKKMVCGMEKMVELHKSLVMAKIACMVSRFLGYGNRIQFGFCLKVQSSL